MTKSEGIRINKYLADSGICSRRSADILIAEGQVQIDGKVAVPGDRVFSDSVVKFDGQVISTKETNKYYALNKPKGYICSSEDEDGRPTCLGLIDSTKRLFTVGRLDLFSEGLIILTNDGDFAQAIIHPKNKISKKYEIVVSGDLKIRNQLSEKFLTGISVDGDFMRADFVDKIGESGNETTFQVQIHQGFNRQLRKMVASMGLRVESLKRVSIGKLELGDLELGKYMEIKKEDVLQESF